ncbi:zinc transporter ZupT [gut metagenome]|uniref:Zinc transporter ZupT n=1 Tax=gut metagenome TaxID=749906 RepID=J9H9J3_9ZZZZ
MDHTPVLLALGLTLLAGLSTGVGSLIALIARKTNARFLSTSLGLSAGVMLYVSFMELMPEAVHLLEELYSERKAQSFMLLAFFLGIGLIALIDYLVPEEENPHELHGMDGLRPNSSAPEPTATSTPFAISAPEPTAASVSVAPSSAPPTATSTPDPKRLKRTGLLMALAIGIHNFPEGLATFSAALTHLDIAIPIVLAIALHNIPEGIAVSVPIYQATGNRRKAFWLSFLSGMAEPLGALIGYLVLLPFWSSSLHALLLAFVSGIMVYISFDELLPETERYGHHHYGVFGVVMGMALMGISLLIL